MGRMSCNGGAWAPVPVWKAPVEVPAVRTLAHSEFLLGPCDSEASFGGSCTSGGSGGKLPGQHCVWNTSSISIDEVFF